MLSEWIVFIVVGRLLIYLWMQFPLPQILNNMRTVNYLHNCDLCSGVWIYSILAGFLQMDLLEPLEFWYVPLLSEILVGSVISFLVHIFVIGWKSKFDTVVL